MHLMYVMTKKQPRIIQKFYTCLHSVLLHISAGERVEIVQDPGLPLCLLLLLHMKWNIQMRSVITAQVEKSKVIHTPSITSPL